MATWKFAEPRLGDQPIAQTFIPGSDPSTASGTAKPKHPVGTILRALSSDMTDDLVHEGEFIYLKGIANTVVGSVVLYNALTGVTALATAGDVGDIAVAMSINLASGWGWYQVQGVSAMLVLSGMDAVDKLIYLTGTAGSTDDAVVAGDALQNAVSRAVRGTPSTGLAYVQLSRPYVNDITN